MLLVNKIETKNYVNHFTRVSCPCWRMKRALPSYDDLFQVVEEGEIEDTETGETDEKNVSDSSEDEMGLKAVLPVGKFNEKFREGDVPESGEQYLCTVRSQRKKLENIVSFPVEKVKRVSLNRLIKKFGAEEEIKVVEMDRKWAETYGTCLVKSEKEFHEKLDEISEDYDLSAFELKPAEWFYKMYETREIEVNMTTLRVFRDEQDICEKLLNLHRRWLESDQLKMESEDEVNRVATWLQALIMCRDGRLTSSEIANLRLLAVALMCRGDRIELKEIILAFVIKYGQIDLITYK